MKSRKFQLSINIIAEAGSKPVSYTHRDGGPNPASNSKLADLIAKAKRMSVPNDNIPVSYTHLFCFLLVLGQRRSAIWQNIHHSHAVGAEDVLQRSVRILGSQPRQHGDLLRHRLAG